MKTKRDTYTEDVSAGRVAIMRDIEKLAMDPENMEDNEAYRAPLCIDTRVEKKILLSTGGPEDGFKLYFDIVDTPEGKRMLTDRARELELSYGVYYRADWGTYKESQLSESEAQTVYEFYMGGYAEI